jgi:hypothetical protein
MGDSKIIQSFQIDLETKRLIEAEAAKRGVSVSEFIRQALLAQCGKDDIESLQRSLTVMVSRALQQAIARQKQRKLRMAKSA